MRRLTKIINKTLSVRISLMVFIAMAILLMASLAVMLYYSRKAVKEEALQKASQTLEAAVQRIDNILLSVEQTSGNIFFSMINHVDDPDMMLTYSRNYGTYEAPYAGESAWQRPWGSVAETALHQFSAAFNGSVDGVLGVPGLHLVYGLFADCGEVLPRNVGATLGVRYSFENRKK